MPGRPTRDKPEPRPRAGVLFFDETALGIGLASAVMYGEPYRGLRRVGPFDAMTPMGRNMHMVAGPHL
jgi:hypothetical protein